MYKIEGKNPSEYVALEIDVDFVTGKRAGDVSPHDPGLICLNLWQNFELGKEMRLIIDDRDPKQYEGIAGITLHKGAEAINLRVSELFKPRYDIVSPELFQISVAQKRIDLSDIDPALSPNEQIKICLERGCLGIKVQHPEVVG